MKKTVAKVKINANEFFNKNIGILGLIVVILFFVVYLLLQKINNLENKVMYMQVKQETQVTVTPSVETKASEMLKK